MFGGVTRPRPAKQRRIIIITSVLITPLICSGLALLCEE